MKKTRSGFTLIEILIVLLIISIVAATAMLTIRSNENKQIGNLAKDLSSILSLASEEAMLRPATLGVAFSPTSIKFLQSVEDKQHKLSWVPFSKPPFQPHPIPSFVQIKVKIGGKVLPLDGEPHLVIPPSGDIPPFIIFLGKKEQNPIYQVTELKNGDIKSGTAEEEATGPDAN